MKNSMICALLAAATLPWLAGCGNAEEAPPAPAPEVLPVGFFKNLRAGKTQTVVVYGTSLTAGGAWANAFNAWLDKEFPGQVKFVNSGGSGQTSSWGVQNVKDKVLAHNPDLVLVEFSYNDAHLKFGMSSEQSAKNLDTIMQALRGQNAQMDIVLQIMNVPWDPPVANKPLANRPKLQDYNDIWRRYARDNKLALLDHYPNWLKIQQEDAKKYEAWLPDGSHPTKEASLAVTWAGVQALLERARKAAEN